MTDDYAAVPPEDELHERPVEAPERPQEPRTRSPRRPARGRGPTTRTGPSRARTRKAPAPAPTAGPEEAIRGLLQIPATAFIMVGQRAESVPLVADGATILVHGPTLAQALAEIAKVDPRFAALLEKLVTFGPYGMAVTALTIMTAQFMRNHESAPAPILEGFGAVAPEQIIAAASIEIPVEVSPNGGRPDGTSPEN